MTVAHVLGHTLGMRHAFRDEEDREACGGKKSDFVMSYGKNRTAWSSCSNNDFKTLFRKISLQADRFCLSGCMPGLWECQESLACIPLEQRCDGVRRHCSDGSDEADCPSTGS